MGLARSAIEEHGAVQKEPELQRLTDFLAGRELNRVLEIGSQDCGMLWLFCQLAAPDAVIVSIDLEVPVQFAHQRDRQTLHYLEADSHAPDTLSEVEWIFDGSLDLLFIDGDHSLSGVQNDWEMYSPLVRPGGIVALHDIVPHANPAAGIEVDAFWPVCRSGREAHEFVCREPGAVWGGALPADSCGIGVVIV